MTEQSPHKFDPDDRRRPRRLNDAEMEEITFPLAWVVLGGLAALIVIGLIGLGVVNIFRQQSITPTPAILPTLVQVENPPVEASTPEPADAASDETDAETTQPSAEQPTFENGETQPQPETPVEAPAVNNILVNGYVKVANTEGFGLQMRAGPGRNNASFGIAEESDEILLFVIDGPRADENTEDYTWWFVRHPNGTEGWVVEDFIAPAGAP